MWGACERRFPAKNRNQFNGGEVARQGFIAGDTIRQGMDTLAGLELGTAILAVGRIRIMPSGAAFWTRLGGDLFTERL